MLEDFSDTRMITDNWYLSYSIDLYSASFKPCLFQARKRYLGVIILIPYHWETQLFSRRCVMKCKNVFITLFEMLANDNETLKLLKWL